jgi:menaquinol-cytochrome c reductase iron-sulfur subunit
MGTQVTTRRNFMVRTISGIFIFIGGVLTIALGGFGIMPALKKREPVWSDAGTVEDLIADQPQERRFFEIVRSGWQSRKQERSVWLVRKADGKVVAYTANCPHLGCGYRWISDHNRFECPCHGSFFDLNGKVLAGPAPRSLDTIETKIENGRLLVRHEVFQLGTTRKVAV